MIFCTWYFLSGKIFYLVLKLDKFIIALKIEQLMDKCCSTTLLYLALSRVNVCSLFFQFQFSLLSFKFLHL